jgi:hypothetical protein
VVFIGAQERDIRLRAPVNYRLKNLNSLFLGPYIYLFVGELLSAVGHSAQNYDFQAKAMNLLTYFA